VLSVASLFDRGDISIPHNAHTREWADSLIGELAAWRADLGRRQTQDRGDGSLARRLGSPEL
jgi:hypothetical protein